MATNWADLSDSDKGALENSSRCFIYGVPKKLKSHGEEKFTPGVVSIGPYHRDKGNLEVTEKHKKLYLKYFIARVPVNASPTPGNASPTPVLDDMVAKIKLIKENARKSYDGDIGLHAGDDFVRMLILDGCFILQLFHHYKLKKEHRLGDDAILFSNNWSIPSLRRDLVLLENQIPFAVLLCLYGISKQKQVKDLTPEENLEFSNLILSFFDPILPAIQPANVDTPIEGEHLLDLLRKYVLHQPGDALVYAADNPIWEHTKSATDLQDAGVRFKKKDTNPGLLDIKFEEGEFEIPPFYFGDSWTALLPNMIALEQCRKDYPDKITSYAILMDNLVDSESDVKLLRDRGIIHGASLENEAIAAIINNLCKGALVDHFYYDLICSRLNEYSQTRRHRWRAAFTRNYINTPWAGVSLLAAICLLLLTLLQTIFGILSWKLAKNSGGGGGVPPPPPKL